MFEKLIFHEALGFPMVFDVSSSKMAAQNDPRSPQDESKIVLERLFCLLNFRFVLGSFSAPFWCRFGRQHDAPGVPPNWGLEGLEVFKTV